MTDNWLSNNRLLTVYWPSNDCTSYDCPKTVEQLSDDCPMTFQWLFNDCPTTVQRLSDDCPMNFQWLFNDCPTTVRRLSDECPTTVRWPSFDHLMTFWWLSKKINQIITSTCVLLTQPSMVFCFAERVHSSNHLVQYAPDLDVKIAWQNRQKPSKIHPHFAPLFEKIKNIFKIILNALRFLVPHFFCSLIFYQSMYRFDW